MNADKLFEAIGAMDEDILERSEYAEPKRRFRLLEALAACFVLLSCLTVVAVLVKNRRLGPAANMPSLEFTTTQSQHEVVDHPFYNEGHWFMIAPENLSYTMNRLSAEETKDFCPDQPAHWMDFSGVVMLLDGATPYRLYLSTPSTVEKNEIGIMIGPYTPSVAAGDDAVYYRCGDVEYAMWEYEDTDSGSWEIGAKATIHGVPVYFQMDKIASADLEKAKADLEALLLCFSEYPADKLDISKIVVSSQPHSWMLKCTREEIESRSEYGILLPHDDKLYENDSIFSENDTVLFTNFEDISIIAAEFEKGGEVYLRWFISYAEGWTDEESSPSPSLILARELSLEKVEELVENSKCENDGEISFTIDYGDAIISIETKDVSAQWLYDQLISARLRLELSKFQTMVAIGQLEGVSLKIYYIDPTILTNAPVSAERLKTWSDVKTICVDDQTLLAHGDSLQKLSVSGFHTPEGKVYENARMCYVFEDAQGNTLLQVSFNGPDPDYVYVNSHPAKYDPMYMDIIQPFLTEEFYDTWKYPQ
ncbi:MAG: hypothetical protein IJN53_01885 [Oscillospiraceae bacterium]|nr:hypothetical protein [Oscillospiraceae bacterium]